MTISSTIPSRKDSASNSTCGEGNSDQSAVNTGAHIEPSLPKLLKSIIGGVFSFLLKKKLTDSARSGLRKGQVVLIARKFLIPATAWGCCSRSWSLTGLPNRDSHLGQKCGQHACFGYHQAVIIPVFRHLTDQPFMSYGKFVAGWAEIASTC